MSGGEGAYIHSRICCKCASNNFVQMKTWNDKFSIRSQMILSGAAVASIKETVVPLGKKWMPIVFWEWVKGEKKKWRGK